MNTLILKNGTEIENLLFTDGSVIAIGAPVEQLPGIYNQLTERNLEQLAIKDADGNTTAVLQNKKLHYIAYSNGEITIHLGNVDMTEKRLHDLEEAMDAVLTAELEG